MSIEFTTRATPAVSRAADSALALQFRVDHAVQIHHVIQR
jgi:hypothetical protein